MTTTAAVPALLGGPPLCPQGPPDWPQPDAAILEALASAYQDGSWGKYQGGHVQRLEERLAAEHGVPHVATCASGTFAVELALRALKVSAGDEVILAAYDYFGNFLSIHAVGALPVLVDLDPDNWNLSPERLAEAFGPKTRAIIASHLHGGLVPMAEVMALAGRHGVPVIEDAAQVPLSRVQGRPAGTWGDVGVLSFGGSKLLSAGRGGALLTRKSDVYQRARLLLTRGGNLLCPLSELQATVLLPQLDQLAARNTRRQQSVTLLSERLGDIAGLRLFRNRLEDSVPGYYKVGLQFDAKEFGLSRGRFAAAMRAEGIALDEGFQALHVGRSPSRFRRAGELSEAERAHTGAVVLHHPGSAWPEQRVEEVAQAVRKIRAYDWSKG